MNDVRNTLYDLNSEATSSPLIIACNLYLRSPHPDHFPPPTNLPAPLAPSRLPTIFPKLDLSITITEPRTHTPIRTTSRADWAFSFNTHTDTHTDSFLVITKAKKHNMLFAAESQLLAYLAIMRELRSATGKTNIDVRDFYTDGLNYVVVAVCANGTVVTSPVLHSLNTAGCKTIFNFIAVILESAMKSTPSATPTNDPDVREKETTRFLS
ncbi:hypothetical protein Q9L58_008324 [Maublancomyces gigas]|uniref:Uncharacterized protein n=1 Tax=Discina gigas TaxID=1032678 RepID=A0ABR3GA07_9PEZI